MSRLEVGMLAVKLHRLRRVALFKSMHSHEGGSNPERGQKQSRQYLAKNPQGRRVWVRTPVTKLGRQGSESLAPYADFYFSHGGVANGKWQIEGHYPTQAKERLDPDFLPRCTRELRVCAFH